MLWNLFWWRFRHLNGCKRNQIEKMSGNQYGRESTYIDQFTSFSSHVFIMSFIRTNTTNTNSEIGMLLTNYLSNSFSILHIEMCGRLTHLSTTVDWYIVVCCCSSVLVSLLMLMHFFVVILYQLLSLLLELFVCLVKSLFVLAWFSIGDFPFFSNCRMAWAWTCNYWKRLQFCIIVSIPAKWEVLLDKKSANLFPSL